MLLWVGWGAMAVTAAIANVGWYLQTRRVQRLLRLLERP